MLDLERRHIAKPVEYRAAGSGPGVLFGYAASFNKYSQNLGGFVEQVAPGAFAKSLGDNLAVLCRYNHDDNYLLGTTEAQTLRLVPDDIGLGYEVDLPDTSSGKDVSVLAKRGDVRYSSFAFYTLEDEWSVTEQGFPLRTLLSVQLVDVAPVNSPAYLDSTAGMRSLADRLDVDVEKVSHASTAELRSLILGEPIELPAEKRGEHHPDGGQGDTHPTISLLQRQHELLKQK
jgi:HK97 family phage prohead protease